MKNQKDSSLNKEGDCGCTSTETKVKQKNAAPGSEELIISAAERAIENVKATAEYEIKSLREFASKADSSIPSEPFARNEYSGKKGVKAKEPEQPVQFLPANQLVSTIMYAGIPGKSSALMRSILGGIIYSRPEKEDQPIPEDDVDIDGVDSDDVYIRKDPNVPVLNTCEPIGTRTCVTRPGFIVYNEYREPVFVTVRLGAPHVNRDGATVCVTVPRVIVAKGKVRSTYYRQIDCECPLDSWTELAYDSQDPWRDLPEIETPIPPWQWCDTDWGRFTLDLLKDLLKSAANGIGSGVGGAVGKAAGDALAKPLKELLDDVVEPIADDIRDALDEAGIKLGDSDEKEDKDKNEDD